MTSRPFSVGSFFTSRSRLRSNVLAVASSRSTSSRVTSLIEMKCRFGGGAGGRSSSRMTRISAIVAPLFWRGHEQNLVDLVDVDEHDRLPLEREVERGRANDRLRMPGRVAAAHLDVVPIEGDVDRAELGRIAGALFDQPAQTVRKRHPA